MPKNYCIMQIWAESGKSALPICNYSQILYQFLTFTQNLKRSPGSAKLELPALAIYIRHDFGHVKSRRQKRPSHHAYRFCYSGSRPSYIMLSSP